MCGLTTTNFTDPSASRNTFSVSTITDGNDRVEGRSILSTLTLAYIEPSPCGGVRPAGDPVDSDPGAVFEGDPHPRSDAGRPLEPWACRHTWEPALPVHLGALLGWVRTVVPVPRGGYLPLRATRLFLLCVSLEVFATPTRRYHGRMSIHPSLPACATPLEKCLHTRRNGNLASPPPPVVLLPWRPHPSGHIQSGKYVGKIHSELSHCPITKVQ